MRGAVGLVLATLVSPLLEAGAAAAGDAPSLTSDIRGITTVWQQEPPPEDGGPPPLRYPLMVAYEARATVVSEQAAVFEGDVWAPPDTIRLADLSGDVEPDALTTWTLRGTPSPVKLQLLNDVGVDFSVAGVNPFGTEVRINNAALGDLHSWAAAPAGALAHEDNVTEAMVINRGMPLVYPPREPSPHEGHLEWEHIVDRRTPTSVAFDPTTGGTYSTEMVADVLTSFLRVEGGDLTQAAAPESVSMKLPQDVRPLGALSITSGLPGVNVSLSTSFPGASQRDFREIVVGASVGAGGVWPESRSAGPVREWMWRPTVVNYGVRRSAGAAMVMFEAPLPAGAEAVARSVDGSVLRIGHRHGPGMLRLVNVEGTQELEFIEAEVPGGSTGPVSPARGGEAGGAPADVSPRSRPLVSPAVRGVAPEGFVSASLAAHEGVPVVEGLRMGDRAYGSLALPSIRVDGALTPVTESRVEALQVLPAGFGNASGTFEGTGFILQALIRTPSAMVEVAWLPQWTNLWETTYLYLLTVHSLDGESHDVDVDWYSRPPADRFIAQGQRVPVEALTHEEFNGDIAAENRPDIVARAGEAGPALRYFLLNPVLLHQGDADGAHGVWALVRDRGITSDPIGQVNAEDLAGDVALYARMRFSGLAEEGLPFQGSIFIQPLPG